MVFIMKELLKKIRTELNYSQQEFADELNVSFATVNRWENGHALPTRIAQTAIYKMCKEDSIPVYEMTLQRIQDIADSIKVSKDRKILYHSSKSGIKGKIAPISRDRCDFGKGFYMGTEPTQGLTLTCDYEDSKFYIVSISTKGLSKLTVLSDIDWAMIVAFNRGRMESIKGTELYNKYLNIQKNKDLIIGCIANDRMFYVIDNFFMGNITDKALVGSLSALQLGEQYVAVSQKACDAVRIETEVEISYLERLALKEVSESNREKGISFANEICRTHRREGLYFDEILERAKEGKK